MSKAHPPDLQELVRRFGGYSAITPQAWAEHDRAVEQYRALMREGFARAPQKPPAAPTPPSGNSGCHRCLRFGEFGYCKDGVWTWTCAEHRLRQFSSDARRRSQSRAVG